MRMYSVRQHEKAIDYAEKRRRYKLETRKEYERAKRREDKFKLLSKHKFPSKNQLERYKCYEKRQENAEMKKIIYSSIDNNYHDVLNEVDRCPNQNITSYDSQNRMENTDGDTNDDNLQIESNEQCAESHCGDDIKEIIQSRLHNYSNMLTMHCCEDLLSFIRKAKINKSNSKLLLQMLKSFLPVPNNLPATMEELLSLLNINNLFFRRSICILCRRSFNHKETQCPHCLTLDHKCIANIYDIDVLHVLTKILSRLTSTIEIYKQQIINNNDEEKTGDIPFRCLYRKLLKKYSSQNLISLLLHLDGIELTTSTQLKLWLFSGSIIELPQRLRRRRYNMILLSMWVGFVEPKPDLWLKSIVNEIQILKSRNIFIDKTTYSLRIYGVTGDCPALKKILNFIGHGGYDCCWFCYVHGEYIGGKLQYCYQEQLRLATIEMYANDSNESYQTQSRVNGHLGGSIIQSLMDVPFPESIIIDYSHVTLLGHTKRIALSIYQKLTPLQRSVLNSQLKKQRFPHFCNRKIRSFNEFAHIKSIELRNLLFYGLLPNLQSILPLEKLAHLALFVCSIRLLHGQILFGVETSKIADKLLSKFYQDHHQFYGGLENFVLHLHSHYSMMYNNHGALANINCLAQEDLIGSVSSNHHGTRYFGELISHYYNIDFSIHNKAQTSTTSNGPKDPTNQPADQCEGIEKFHFLLCHNCNQLNSCVTIYRRFVIQQEVFHSLIYDKRQQSISYFVEYSINNCTNERKFGIIQLFFTHLNNGYALIAHYPVKYLYSDCFTKSKYSTLLKDPLNALSFILEKNSENIDLVRTDCILAHCVVIEMENSLFVTRYSSYNEHD